MKNKYVDDITDQLDAAVFTGDTFADDDDRAEFRELMNRWTRQMAFFDDLAKDRDGNTDT